MRRVRLVAAMAGCVILATMLTSCSGKPKLSRVYGKVFYEGAPAEGAVVMFHPVNTRGKVYHPQGVVGKDGSFQLTTFVADDGAPAGQYYVTVVWEMMPEDGEAEENFIVIPERYCRPDSSGLIADVHDGVTQLAPFELTE